MGMLSSNNEWRKRFSIQPHPTYLSIWYDLALYVGWSCILNCFMLSSLPCFYALCWSAIPSSHYIFNDFFIFYYCIVCLRVYNAQECKKYLIQCAGVLTKLTMSGYELLFISLAFMVQNDYGCRGCMMNILTRLCLHKHHNTLWVLSLWPQ